MAFIVVGPFARSDTMTNKGMGEKSGHIGSDEWKNDKQNQQRGSEKKGERAAADAGNSLTQSGTTGEPGQSQGVDTRTAHPGKGG
jgi:hypothetical protein